MIADAKKIIIPIKRDYRFIHRPLDRGDWGPCKQKERSRGRELCHYVDHEERVSDRFSAFLRSEGGCLILCGYPGVGKTTFVKKMLEELEKEFDVVAIWLNIARPVDDQEVKFRIIRKLHKAFLEGRGRRLPKGITEQLRLLYVQTLIRSYKSTTTKSQSRTSEIETSILSLLSTGGPKLAARIKSDTVRALETVRHEYDDAMADEDIQDLLRRIYQYQHRSLPRRIWNG